MKRSLSLALALLIAVTAFFSIPILARAESGAEQNFAWALDDGELTIDARGEGVVDSAPFSEFADRIEEITINEGITMISPSIFAGFENVERVLIPSSCGVIGESAFAFCSRLREVSFAEGLKTIGNGAFANCPKLKSVTIPDSVTEIGSVAFGFVENKADEQYDLLDGFSIRSSCKNAAVKAYVDEMKEIEGASVPWKKIHRFDDGKITKLPTCKEEGLKVYTCATCGAKKKETLPKGGHNFEGLITPATTTKNGKIEVYCWVCGYVKSSGVIYKASGISLSKTSFVYNGKAQKPKVAVKDSKGKEIPSGNYTITYSNKKSITTGTYKVTVRLSGIYSGEKVLKYKIVPAKVRDLKKIKVSSSSVSFSWSKAAGAKYYAVQYSKDGKSWSFATKATKATAFTVKALKAGTKYSFRVKALDSTKKLSGKYSDILRVKTRG